MGLPLKDAVRMLRDSLRDRLAGGSVSVKSKNTKLKVRNLGSSIGFRILLLDLLVRF